MSGLKKTFEMVGGPFFVWAVIAGLGIATIVYFTQPKANPFKPMELACVDVQGKVAAKDNTLRYYRDGGTIVGYDEAGNFYVYTPPPGWGCRFGEEKTETGK